MSRNIREQACVPREDSDQPAALSRILISIFTETFRIAKDSVASCKQRKLLAGWVDVQCI